MSELLHYECPKCGRKITPFGGFGHVDNCKGKQFDPGISRHFWDRWTKKESGEK